MTTQIEKFCEKYGVEYEAILDVCNNTEYCPHLDNINFDCEECDYLEKNKKIYPQLTAEKILALEELIMADLMTNYLSMKEGLNSFIYQLLLRGDERISVEEETRPEALAALCTQLDLPKDEVKKIMEA
jgi:hypothetical protein